MSDIADSIRRLTKRGEAPAHLAKVVSVDRAAHAAARWSRWATSPRCRIRGSRPRSRVRAGLVLFPKVGSVVVVLLLSDAHAAVVLAEEVEEVQISVGPQNLTYDKNGLSVKGPGGNLTYDKNGLSVKGPGGNLAKDLVALLEEVATAFGELAVMQVVTPVGPGTVFPNTIAKLQASKLKLETIIKPALESYLHAT